MYQIKRDKMANIVVKWDSLCGNWSVFEVNGRSSVQRYSGTYKNCLILQATYIQLGYEAVEPKEKQDMGETIIMSEGTEQTPCGKTENFNFGPLYTAKGEKLNGKMKYFFCGCREELDHKGNVVYAVKCSFNRKDT